MLDWISHIQLLQQWVPSGLFQVLVADFSYCNFNALKDGKKKKKCTMELHMSYIIFESPILILKPDW